MKRTLTLENCEVVREGISATGRSWTMYNCTDTEKRRYTSFTNMTPYLNIEREYEVNQKESEKNNPKTGKHYLNYTIELPKLAPKSAVSNDTTINRIEIKIDKILSKIDTIETMLDAIPEEQKEEIPPIGDNDIPF